MQGAKATATSTSSNGSPKVAPPELGIDANATAMHVPHASHAPTEAYPVLNTPDWQAVSQFSQMSQVPLLPNGTPENSMFARSALEPAESSMAGGLSAPPSAPASMQGGECALASMPSMHGAVDSEMASIHGDPSEFTEAPSRLSTPRLAPMHSLSSMHGGGGGSILGGISGLGGIQGGPSALASSMHGGGASMMGGTGVLGSMHGGLSMTGSRMGGGDDSLMMPCPGGAATRTAAAALAGPWYAPSQHTRLVATLGIVSGTVVHI